MPKGPADAVRTYQLPANSPGQLYLSQYNLADTNTPVYLTPGFGGSGGGPLPPLLSGSGYFKEKVTSYLGQVTSEMNPFGVGPITLGAAPRDDSADADPSHYRTAHVKRIFATVGDASGQPSDQINPDIWIDVLRIDKLPTMFQTRDDDGKQGQVIKYVLIWNDDPNNPIEGIDNSQADIQGENANPGRSTVPLDVLNPTSPADDHPQLRIVRKQMFMAQSDDQTGKAGQIIHYVYDNTPLNEDPGNGPDVPSSPRQVDVIKVINNDLGGMQMSDPDGSNPVLVDWQVYLQALQAGKTDDNQYITTEVTKHFTVITQSDEKTGAAGQEVTYVLGANQQVVKLFEQGDPNAVDSNGNYAVFRTDPLQTIVNVGFGGIWVLNASAGYQLQVASNDPLHVTFEPTWANIKGGADSSLAVPYNNVVVTEIKDERGNVIGTRTYHERSDGISVQNSGINDNVQFSSLAAAKAYVPFAGASSSFAISMAAPESGAGFIYDAAGSVVISGIKNGKAYTESAGHAEGWRGGTASFGTANCSMSYIPYGALTVSVEADPQTLEQLYKF